MLSPMFSFWKVYVSVAVIGTVAIYYFAPLARPWLASHIKTKVFASPFNKQPRPALVLKTVASRSPRLPTDVIKPSVLAIESITSNVPVQPIAITVPANIPSKTNGENDLPPALNGIYLTRSGEMPGWGITHQRATIYTLDGDNKGYVSGGTLIDYRATRTSSKGEMVECLTLGEQGQTTAPVLISIKELYLFTASYSKLSARQLSALKSFYALNEKIVLRKNEMLLEAGAKNPHFNSYQIAYKKLMAQIDNAKVLITQRDNAKSSLEKMRFEDTLRTMKMDEGRLRSDYDKAHLAFLTWKQAHAQEMPKPENDPKVRAWAQEMNTLRILVPGLAY